MVKEMPAQDGAKKKVTEYGWLHFMGKAHSLKLNS
jgi:hypothetical protein